VEVNPMPKPDKPRFELRPEAILFLAAILTAVNLTLLVVEIMAN
jgi:hypothetical protein